MNDLLSLGRGQTSGSLRTADAEAADGREGKPGRGHADTFLTAALLILIAVLWLATRPYQGVIQDARLYMVAALRELHSARFTGDLYFQFGSQNRFTLYSRLCAPLLAILGVGTTGIVLTVAGQMLWVGGLVYLARGLIRDRWHALLAVAAVIALPSAYCVAIHYGEPFLTPRSLAEALTMIALGLLVRRHAFPVLAVFALSAAIHPIMTLPGLAIALIYLAFGRPLWWVALAGGAVAAAGLALAGVEPFANLRITMDPQWFDVVKVQDRFCFITRWSIDGYFRTLGTIALAVLALVLAEPRERRLLGAALIVGLGGLLGTLIGADLLHNVFIIEIQQYRAMWPLTVMANLYIIPTFAQLHRQGNAIDLSKVGYFIAIAALFLSHFVSPVIFVAAPMLIITSAFAIWQYRVGRRLSFVASGPYLLLLALGCIAVILFLIWFKDSVALLPREFFRTMYSMVLVVTTLIIISIIFVYIITPPERDPRTFGHSLPWLAAALLPVALLGWDQRMPWTRFVESSGPAPAALAALLPQNASVYWEGGVRMLWLRLQRPSYFSCVQGAGSIFFRGTAIAHQHRAESLRPLRTLDFQRNGLCPSLGDKRDRPERTRADLTEVCRREPGLDDLVLIRPVMGVTAKIWDSPAPYQDVRFVKGKLIVHETNRFYIYSCAEVR